MRTLAMVATLIGAVLALRALSRYVATVEADIAAGLAELEHRD
jgi:hypothetical protein